MRKAVSKGRYTLFFTDKRGDIDCVAYETGRHMAVSEIAKALNISPVASRNSIKKSIAKVYGIMKRRKIRPVDIIISMAMVFNVNKEEEYRQFIRLLPEKAIGELYEDART